MRSQLVIDFKQNDFTLIVARPGIMNASFSSERQKAFRRHKALVSMRKSL